MSELTELIAVHRRHEFLHWIQDLVHAPRLLIHRLHLLLYLSVNQVANVIVNLLPELTLQVLLLLSCIRRHLSIHCLHFNLERGHLLLYLLESFKD